MSISSKVLCAVFALASAPAFAAEPAAETFTMKNGLEVIVLPNHRVAAVSHTIWYRIGAADDPAGKSGLAHFHEHVMFLGTAKHKAGEYSDLVTHHGGEHNAFTGYDATAYYINIAKEELPLAMELEADRMRGLTPTDKDVTKEKQVIIEERRMRIENSPDALLDEQVNAALFRNHPYHTPTIGWKNEMEGLTKQDVIDFHKKYYHPNNAILIISGDVEMKEVRPLAEKYYGNIPSASVPPRIWNQEPPQLAARSISMQHVNVKQPQWQRAYAAASLGNGDKKNALPLFMLSQILGGGKGSRLYQSLVVQQKIASGIDSSYNGLSIGPAEFTISVTPEEDVKPEMIEKAVDAELKKFINGTMTDLEFTRAKTLLKAESIYAREGLSSMAQIMGWVRMLGLDKEYFIRWPTLIEAVTKEDVIAAAKDTLQMKQSVSAWLVPEAKP